MCGIAGVISSNPAAIEPAVRRMMRAMVHRGPDDDGYGQFPLAGESASVGFGFRRLAILDLSPAGHQPMVDPATGNALIFNGEIYNFRDLRPRLEGLGCQFRSSGDTEVLLHALSAWGEQALDELDGMFAFAFYHAATRRVLLARDPLGIKPLYVARAANSIVFASEVRALLASGLVPSNLDPAGIAGFLAYGAPQDPLTVHAHVRSLPAATLEWVDASSLSGGLPSRRRYWRFPAAGPACEDEAAVAQVRELLADSVSRQCVSDVPLGVFLSAGIDSATIAALAMQSQGAASTFAVGYDVPGIADETAAAAETAHFLGTRHFQTIVDGEWAIAQWTEWLKATDRPSIDGLNTYIVSGAVKDRDITVALSGLGADELFGGYPTFRRVPRLQRLLRLVAWLPRGLRRAAAAALLAPLPAGKRAKAIDLISSGTSAVELAALSRRVIGNGALRSLGLDARQLGLSPLYLAPEAHEAFGSGPADSFSAVSQAELSLYMGNTLLRDSDTNSMAHSLEIRVPFLGQRLVDTAAGMPGSVRMPTGALPKHLLRRAVADSLPQSVFTRPKTGFSLPFDEWMRGPLRDSCEAAIDTLANCPLFEAGAIRQTWDRFTSRPGEVHWSRALALVVLGTYLGKRTPGPSPA
ncbi:MAG: asparagine synthase (glutamine-hydrolyzing) [Planctomycetia bacterium]